MCNADKFISEKVLKEYHHKLNKWYCENKREFTWRYTFNQYKILVSEILLQQTNVEKVIQPYLSITDKYKTIEQLAEADINFLEDIFKDLGLFYRAERLINISRDIIENYNGEIPYIRDELIKINGIGDYTCNAILCFGFNESYAIVDTNVIRVFDRVFNYKSNSKRPHTDKKLWKFGQLLLPVEEYVSYNYALLDFAAITCTARKPKCDQCPLSEICIYFKENILIN